MGNLDTMNGKSGHNEWEILKIGVKKIKVGHNEWETWTQ
jgi:hypothetical protein